jgi:hypothetical protein
MKKKIEDVEYEIIPIPPSLSPFSTRISKLLQQEPKTVEEAKEISAEIKAAMDILLEGTVSPKPKKGHRTQVFNSLNLLTKEAIEDAEFFRKPKRRSSRESSSTGDNDSQETKRTP